MSWEFSANAKKVRRSVYGQFLHLGRGDNTAAIMADTGLSLAEVHDALKELERGLMVMLQPETYDVVKCPPWTNTPSRHVIERDGQHVCFAGCCVEAINMSYCYPGDTLTIRSQCPHSAREIRLRFKDGQLLDYAPAGLVMHFGTNPVDWPGDWFKACEHNNFFASADDVRAWETLHPEFAGALITIDKAPRLAKYDCRLDYERGADVHPAIMLQFLQDVGVTVPAAWKATT